MFKFHTIEIVRDPENDEKKTYKIKKCFKTEIKTETIKKYKAIKGKACFVNLDKSKIISIYPNLRTRDIYGNRIISEYHETVIRFYDINRLEQHHIVFESPEEIMNILKDKNEIS